MDKKDFISMLETVLLCADLDVTGLKLEDDSHVTIIFKGGGRRRGDIEADSRGAIITDVMKHVF